MIYKKVYFSSVDPTVYLTTYATPSKEMPPKDAILVVPGGGYGVVCSDKEGEPIALAYVAKGLSAFVLNYTAPPKHKDQPLIEAAKAILHIRNNARAYGINPDRVFVVGFSAGAHLVGTLSTKYRRAEEILGLPQNSVRPNGTVYAYPVVTAMTETHIGSFQNLLGKPFEEISEEEKKEYSLELLVDKNTPPAFIWHTATDKSVPVYGALRLAESYVRAGVTVEMRLYPYGPHGMALAVEHDAFGHPEYVDERVSRWLSESVEWMKTIS